MAMHTVTTRGLRPLPLALLSHAIPMLSRTELEDIVERLIEELDSRDGDVDLEDDDPAGDPLDERGEAPTDDGTELLGMPPRYGVDQSCGPINEKEALRAHYLAAQQTQGGEILY